MPDPVDTFEANRERLFGIAYRMLGRVSDAEDVVQDAYLRWHETDPAEIDRPDAFLATVTTRLCLDSLKSARAQRETYTGTWLPEPLMEERTKPEHRADRATILSTAWMVVLETLTPVQRAVFVLREGFDMSYTSIGAIVDRSPGHCRKIAQRARTHVGDRNRRFPASRDAQEAMVSTFIDAIDAGDPERLGALLAEDAVVYSDGGGEVTAALRPIEGRDRITRFLLGIAKKAPADRLIQPVDVNGAPGVAVHLDGRLQSVWAVHVEDRHIHHLYAVLNPEKLRHLTK